MVKCVDGVESGNCEKEVDDVKFKGCSKSLLFGEVCFYEDFVWIVCNYIDIVELLYELFLMLYLLVMLFDIS